MTIASSITVTMSTIILSMFFVKNKTIGLSLVLVSVVVAVSVVASVVV